jgi:hypothetical protein
MTKVNAGEQIVCLNGHICGKVLIDLSESDVVVLPKNRREGKAQFSVEIEIVEVQDTGHVCKTCGAQVTSQQNGAWRIHTKQGWMGEFPAITK